MRIQEIMETASVGGTCAGGVATVAQPLGSIISREQTTRAAKYQNSAPRMGQNYAKRNTKKTLGQ
jgi:hypothetical protein